MVYGTISSQDRVLFSVIFTRIWIIYFPGFNAIILRSGNFEMVFWATVHILQFMKEWNKRNMSGLTSYEYFFSGWLNSWCAQWFVSLQGSPTKGEEKLNDVENDTQLVW